MEKFGISCTTFAAGRSEPTLGRWEKFVGNSIVKHLVAGLGARADLAHVHHRISYLTLVSVVSFRLRRLPVLVTVHGTFQTLFRRKPGIDLVTWAYLALSDHVVVVNEDLRRQIEETSIRTPVDVVPAYIPPSAAEIGALSDEAKLWLDDAEKKEVPVLSLTAYRLLPPPYGETDVYGLRHAAMLVEKLAERGVGFQMIVMLGMAPLTDKERDFLGEITSRIKAKLGRRFLLRIGEFAPAVIARSTLLVRPTKFDGDAISIREALSLGVPVVASDVAPRPAGVVTYRHGDDEDLVSKVIETMCRPPESSSCGDTAASSDHEFAGRLTSIYYRVGASIDRA